ncbi:MAG: hypothetical protein KatS3mg076_2964 [Candidatus Binatia bacterium]|nr:MAG: hypothetical protein KatS3mg076_2964 [Candidatus Binatia bacterium]
MWVFAASTLLALLAWGIYLFPQRIHHDNAMYLDCARLLLEGALPYVDFIDPNPPLVMYLSVPPVWVAQKIGAPPASVFLWCVFGAVCWSVLALYRLGRPSRNTGVLAFAWAAFHFVVWDRGDFGQREHLFATFAIPFLFLRWNRSSGLLPKRSSAIATGFLAGVGTSLKPHFLLPVLGAEAALLAAPRARRPLALAAPEVLSFAFALGLYGAHFLVLPDPVRTAFFERWLPFLLDKYSSYDAPWMALLHRATAGAMAVFVAWLGLVLYLKISARPSARLAAALALFTLGGLAAYAVQRKGWHYQEVPALAGAVLCLPALLLWMRDRWVQNRPLSTSPPLAAAPLVVAAIATCLFVRLVDPNVSDRVLALFSADRDATPSPTGFERLIELHSRTGEPVLVLSTSVRPAYPALFLRNRRPGSRYLWLFPLPGLARSRQDGASLTKDERLFLTELTEDVQKRRPALVVLPTGPCQSLGGGRLRIGPGRANRTSP